MTRILAGFAAAIALVAAGPAAAWGDLGHKVTALIAYRHLTPAARAKVLLAPVTLPSHAR